MKLPLAILLITILLPSCGVHLGADGSKDVTIDSSAFAVALKVIAEK